MASLVGNSDPNESYLFADHLQPCEALQQKLDSYGDSQGFTQDGYAGQSCNRPCV